MMMMMNTSVLCIVGIEGKRRTLDTGEAHRGNAAGPPSAPIDYNLPARSRSCPVVDVHAVVGAVVHQAVVVVGGGELLERRPALGLDAP